MVMKRIYYLFFLLPFLSGCKFNKMFLDPIKLSSNSTMANTWVDGEKTIVFFSGQNHQPSFSDSLSNAELLGYDIESILFPNESGTLLNGWMLTPADGISDITLLHYHGNSGFILNQHQAIAPLIKMGFRVFTFDYSGFGFSGGEASNANIFSDGMSALNYLKNRAETKNTPIVLYGQSMGGHVATIIAAQNQSDIDGVVIEGAFTSYRDITSKRIPVVGGLMMKQGRDAIDFIRRNNKPLLVIHSTEDKIIPYQMGKTIFDNANNPKTMYTIKKCHSCGPIFYADSIAYKIRAMFQ